MAACLVLRDRLPRLTVVDRLDESLCRPHSMEHDRIRSILRSSDRQNSKEEEHVMFRKGQRRPLSVGILIVAIALLAILAASRTWYPTTGQYTFTPCPGLTLTSTATTGIWNCPNQPVTTFADGQEVTIKGTWATGYGTLGCVPQNGQPCAVPQLASLQEYVYANIDGGMWFVVQWRTPLTVQLTDGQTVTVSGILKVIIYPSSPGATYPIFHLNNQTGKSNLLQPQPSFEIVSAVLD